MDTDPPKGMQVAELSLAASKPVSTSRVLLAPMEGVVDYAMRKLLTELGGYHRCVTEFIRVTDVLLPERVFFRYCPELRHGCLTSADVPVHIQLLGSDARALALNARRAIDLGAPGVDLNFGCPAKTVNRSNGGSVLLKEPSQVAAIVREVRESLPSTVPVSAKIRLGYESPDFVMDIAAGIAEAGADELCVHARTKSDGYKPPAYWSKVASVTRELNIPVIINGEIWTLEDMSRACRESGCVDVMLGRGALSRPDLALAINRFNRGLSDEPLPWSEIVRHVDKQFERSDKHIPRYIGNRTKQWLAYLKREYSGARILFNTIKPLHDESEIRRAIQQHRNQMSSGAITEGTVSTCG